MADPNTPKPGKPGNETWGNAPDANRRHVGACMVPGFDPELNLIYMAATPTDTSSRSMSSGQVLWEGRQYIAVSTGNSLVSSGLNTLAPELHPSNNTFVFALGETN